MSLMGENRGQCGVGWEGVKRSALGFRAPGLRERKIMISRRKKSSQKEGRVTEATGPRWPVPSPLRGD